LIDIGSQSSGELGGDDHARDHSWPYVQAQSKNGRMRSQLAISRPGERDWGAAGGVL